MVDKREMGKEISCSIHENALSRILVNSHVLHNSNGLGIVAEIISVALADVLLDPELTVLALAPSKDAAVFTEE